VAETLLAVTAPPKSEADSSVTCAVVHDDPLAADERNLTTGALVGYAEAPRL
jgi:hypothetical protein